MEKTHWLIFAVGYDATKAHHLRFVHSISEPLSEPDVRSRIRRLFKKRGVNPTRGSWPTHWCKITEKEKTEFQ